MSLRRAINIYRGGGITPPPPPYVIATTNTSLVTTITLDPYQQGSGPSADSELFKIMLAGVTPSSGNVTATLSSSDFEIWNGSAWSSGSINVAYSGMPYMTALIYKVRLKAGLLEDDYSCTLTLEAGNATDWVIDIDASVTATHSFEFIDSIEAYGADSSNTTTAVDTTGANLITVSCMFYGVSFPTNPTVTDNKGNTYTLGSINRGSGNGAGTAIFYCINPTVGTGHTFTGLGSTMYPSIVVDWFSSTGTVSFDDESSASAGSATVLSTGSVTPAKDGNVFISAVNYWVGNTPMINSGFTINGEVPTSPATLSGASAYLIQSVADSLNPQWSWTIDPGSSSACIICFKSE